MLHITLQNIVKNKNINGYKKFNIYFVLIYEKNL